jgi:predicted esterase
VPGFADAVVAVPARATSPRPVVVALHGNFDRPEWQCGVWEAIVRARAFVLCPRGVPRRDAPKSWDRWEYRSAKTMEQELDAALAALEARYSGYVAGGSYVFVGFSLGAIYGAPLVQKHPERFPRVVFIEGGIGAWSTATARSFVRRGGARLMLACGQADCVSRAKRLAPLLDRAGLPTRTGGVPNAGHSYDGEVAKSIAEQWEWLIEGDPRWQT